MRILTGIKPTGRLHLGNYFAVVKPCLDFQHHRGEALYLLANLHALTVHEKPVTLQQWTFDLAVDLLALGLDPTKAALYVQADVPEVTELAWLLATVTETRSLETCSNFEQKMAEGFSQNHALLSYPVLMAADILSSDADVVCVGADQKAHADLCLEVAERFNDRHGEVFRRPEIRLLDASLPGLDCAEKMSKNSRNALSVLEDPAQARDRLGEVGENGDGDSGDAEQTLFALYSAFVSEEERRRTAAALRSGQLSPDALKGLVADQFERTFEKARERRRALVEEPEVVLDVLDRGARCARRHARRVLDRAKRATGAATTTLMRAWLEATPHSIFDDYPELDALQEPTRTEAAMVLQQLHENGQDGPDAARLARRMAEEWELSRMPTIAPERRDRARHGEQR